MSERNFGRSEPENPFKVRCVDARQPPCDANPETKGGHGGGGAKYIHEAGQLDTEQSIYSRGSKIALYTDILSTDVSTGYLAVPRALPAETKVESRTSQKQKWNLC